MNTVYFLGAGATKADYPDVPLGDDLLHSILQRRGTNHWLQEFLRQVFDDTSTRWNASRAFRPRLDDVFTLIDAHLQGRAPAPSQWSREDLLLARRQLVAGIGVSIAEALGGLPAPTSTAFAQSLRPDNSTVISTNYDIVLDNCLADIRNIHYGIPARYPLVHVGVMPGPPTRRGEVHHFYHSASLTLQIGGVPLLKLHGSLNWLYCSRCDELDVTLHDKGAVYILVDPELGRCAAASCTGRYEPLVVGPSLEQRYDERPLRETWSLAERALRVAERLVIIGYSLPEADYLIRCMLTRNFGRRSEQVTVVSLRNEENKNEADALQVRYRRLFPKAEFEWDGFGAYTRSVLQEQNG